MPPARYAGPDYGLHQQQQRAREVAAVKTPAAVSSPKAAVADGSDNWETF
ncbi:chemotaxis protein [Salmonella enterica subsp. enterica serovar Typhimurium]|nr:chemotaxis protein [Salmonella enterica subsp. enterica serovar Typhimurium]